MTLAAKGRLYSVCLGIMPVWETWLVKADDVIRLERNDATMIR